MSTDTIERDVEITAPIDRVWSLITEADNLGTWFGDAGADIDLRPGGALEVRWEDDHRITGVVQVVDPTSTFAFRWAQLDTPPGVDLGDGNSTLVEFTLIERDDTTLVRVVESGFASLEMSDDDRQGLYTGHCEGWPRELGDLERHATVAVA